MRDGAGITFLVELDFDGWKQRFTAKEGGVSVPYSDGDDVFFDGLVLNTINVKTTFSLLTMRSSIGNVVVQIANKGRFQDNEVNRVLDGGVGKIYVWTEGLDWADIKDYPIFKGEFKKRWHDKYRYEFELTDMTKFKFLRLPQRSISPTTFPAHRTEGGAGSVAGKPMPIVFGDWPKAVSLLCTDTANFYYTAGSGVLKSTDAEYTATTENVYDKNGSVVGAGGYTLTYPIDGEGYPHSRFDFGGDKVASEPLSCSIRGLPDDGAGTFTSTASAVVEHPADILHYIAYHFSNFSPDDYDANTLKTIRAIIPGIKFATIINAFANGADIWDRLLSQCQCTRIQRWGKIGAMAIDMEGIRTAYISKLNLLNKTVKITKTPESMLCNNLKVFYAFNPTTKSWEGELMRDRSNHSDCSKSYNDYGETPQQEFYLPDVQSLATATALADRWLKIRVFRLDIIETYVPYWEGWNMLEGDIAALTLEEGASLSGAGFVDEPAVLLEKGFGKNKIYQKWLRTRAD